MSEEPNASEGPNASRDPNAGGDPNSGLDPLTSHIPNAGHRAGAGAGQGQSREIAILILARGAQEENLVRTLAAHPDMTVVRRCADMQELLGAVYAGLGTVAIIDQSFGPDRARIHQIHQGGCHVLVLCDEEDKLRIDAMGALALPRGLDATDAVRTLARSELEIRELEAEGPGEAGQASGNADPDEPADPNEPPSLASTSRQRDGAGRTRRRRAQKRKASALHSGRFGGSVGGPRGRRGARANPGSESAAPANPGSQSAARVPQSAPQTKPPRPRTIVVTGSSGSPGRSTIAANLAETCARFGIDTVLIDADIWDSSLAVSLGLLSEAAGLAGAVHAANQGRLDRETFDQAAPPIREKLALLPGMAQATRYREINPAAIVDIVEAARRSHHWVIIEAPRFVPEGDVLIGRPSRNEVARQLLKLADEIIVVGAGEPLGMQRLINTLLELKNYPHTGEEHVLVNKVRTSAAGPQPEDSIYEGLARFAAVPSAVIVPDDRGVCDKAELHGQTWYETAKRSVALAALEKFAASLVVAAGGSPPPSARWDFLPAPIRRLFPHAKPQSQVGAEAAPSAEARQPEVGATSSEKAH